MISPKETISLLDREPCFADSFCSLQAIPRLPKGMLKETKDAIAYARKFCDEVIRPVALEVDRQTHADPEYLLGFDEKGQ